MTNDLLERRADRGTPRGAAQVWTEAHRTASAGAGGGADQRRSRAPFRLILVGLIVSIGAVLIIGLSGLGEWSIQQPDRIDQADRDQGDDRDDQDDGSEQGSDPRPPSLRIEGFDRTEVSGPPPLVAPTVVDPIEHFIYASSTDPWSESIVGVEQLSDGYRVWGVNLDLPLVDYAELVTRTPSGWELEPNELQARVGTTTDRMFGSWQFTFVDGDEQAVLLATPHSGNDPVDGLWSHLAWAATSEPRPSIDVSRTTAVGEPALVFEFGGGQYDELVWADGDFTYWLRSWEGASGPPTEASLLADRIYLDGDSISVRDAVPGVSGSQALAFMLLLVVVIAIVASVGFFLLRGPRILALVVGWILFLAWGADDEGWLWLGLSVVVLAGVWMLRVFMSTDSAQEAEPLGQSGGADPG